MMGGILSNNSSGMQTGTRYNAYLVGLRVNDLGAADVEAGLLGGGVDLLLAAHQDGGKEVAG